MNCGLDDNIAKGQPMNGLCLPVINPLMLAITGPIPIIRIKTFNDTTTAAFSCANVTTRCFYGWLLHGSV